MIKKILTKSALLGVLFIQEQTASMIAGALALTTAGVGGGYTYKTLMYQPESSRNRFPEAYRAFAHEMAQSNPQCASIALRQSLINFDKHFLRHEKVAIIASASACIFGTLLTMIGVGGSVWSGYKYCRADDADRNEHLTKLITRLKLSGIGLLSLLVGVISTGLLADYAQSDPCYAHKF